MALFKISKGIKANLPPEKTAGHCWYTIDDSLFYIDYEDSDGVVQRKALNASDAETLTGASLATILNSSDLEIPTSKAVLDKFADYTTTAELTKQLTELGDSKVDVNQGPDNASKILTVGENGIVTPTANIVYVGPTEPTDPNVLVWVNTSEEWEGAVTLVPRLATISLPAANWTGDAQPYSQAVVIDSVATNSKIDLQPTAHQIVDLQVEEIVLMAENNNGVITVYAIGGIPSFDMTMQVLITEVEVLA